MRTLLLVIFLAPALGGCAKFMEKFGRTDGSQTEVSFAGDARGLEALATLSGKLMVYAIGTEPGSLRKTFRFDNEEVAAGSQPVVLKNGPYRFFFVGFSGSGMGTDVRCGLANNGQPVQLIGQPVTISVAMSRANCNHPDFTANADQTVSGTGFETMKLVSCQSGTALGGFTEASDCTTGAKGDITHYNSIKVELLGYETMQGDPPEAESLRPGIESSCIKGEGKPGFNAAFSSDTSAWSTFALSDSIIFFGLASNGIYRSDDGGSSFASVVASVAGQAIAGSGTAVVAATSSGIRYSANSGAAWSTAAAPANTGSFWAVHAISSSVFLAGRDNGVAYKSTDGGANWTALGTTGLAAVETIFADATGTHVWVGGTGGGLAKLAYSSDGGANFTNIFSASEAGVWVVKVINGLLYWGTDAGLYRSASVTGTSPTQYCSTGCANTARLPNNAVSDVIAHEGTLYISTAGGIAVNVGIALGDATAWTSYTGAELGGSKLNAKKMAFANGKLWYAAYAAGSDPARVSDSRGSGGSFPSSGNFYLPTGGSTNLPLATKVTVYNDPLCQSSRRSFLFPRGVGSTLLTPSGEAALKSGAAAENRLFLRDF